MKKFVWYFLLTFLFITLLSNCTKQEENSAQKIIKIGVVAPYEGSNAHIGKMIMNSVRLFFDSHKDENFTIKLIPIDTKSNPPEAVAAIQSIAADKDVKGLIAFYHSSTALACKPIIQEAKIPTLIYSASNPKVTDNASYYFRLVPTDDNQAIVLTDFAKHLGAKRISILYYADEYGKGLADGIQKRAMEVNLDIVGIESYDETTMDFRPILTIIKNRDPDVIMICGFVEKSIAILNQAAGKNIRATFLAGDGTFNEDQLIKGAGKNAEGVYVAAPYVFDDSNPKNMAFLEAYWKKYDKSGEHRKPASWTAFAYDASGILFDALASGNFDRQSIFKYIKKINNKNNGYNGITGLIYFNDKGDAVGRKFKLAIVKNGKFVAIK